MSKKASATCRPSGLHRADVIWTVPMNAVNGVSWPVSVSSTNTLAVAELCVAVGPLDATKARRRPSGAHDGETARRSVVSRRVSPVCTSTV